MKYQEFIQVMYVGNSKIKEMKGIFKEFGVIEALCSN